MKKSVLTLVLYFSFIIINFSFAQSGIQWQKCLGGSGYDIGNSIQPTLDGGYIVAGHSGSHDGDVTGNHSTVGTHDYWIVKIDSLGAIQWQKSLGGASEDYGTSIRQTTDGGYIVVGYADSNGGDVTGHHGTVIKHDYWVVKLDGNGNIQWQKSLGGTFDDFGYSVEQTVDGGYIVAGASYSNDGDVTNHHGSTSTADVWLVKLDNNGNIQWEKSFGGTNQEWAYSIKQTTDGGYIVVGSGGSSDGDISGCHADADWWVLKINNVGTIQWQRCLGGSGEDIAYAVQQTLDGGYIIAGYSGSSDGDATINYGYFDYWIIKLDGGGTIQWQKALGGSGREKAFSIELTSDGGYIVAGYSESNDGHVSGHHGYYDYWIVKLNINGDIQWQKSLGGTGDDFATAIKPVGDGGFIISGYTESNDDDVTGFHGGYDFWIVKLSPYVGIDEYTREENNFFLFPNPTANELMIENSELKIERIEIYNTVGEKVFSQPVTSNPKQVTINVADFLPGIYFITVTDQTGSRVTRKIVKM